MILLTQTIMIYKSYNHQSDTLHVYVEITRNGCAFS